MATLPPTPTTQACLDATRAARGKLDVKDGRLVLQLLRGDCLVIGDKIVVEASECRQKDGVPSLRVSVFAPADMSIDRGEIFLAKRNNPYHKKGATS